MDFLWHKVSEKEKEEIRQQAKKIMDNFSRKLGEVKGEIKDSGSEKGDFEREEGKGSRPEIDKKIMLENAPNKNKDSIIAEKGEWE